VFLHRPVRRRLQGSLLPLLCLWWLGCLALSGCTRGFDVKVRPGERDRGVASWYGAKFHGRLTANGETYDMNALTAAHRELPFGTWLEITNLRNGRKTRVRINDRGPFIDGRVLDLSYGAARELGMVDTGLTRVEMRVVAPPHSPRATPQGRFRIQIAAFGDPDRADQLVLRLQATDPTVHVVSDGVWHRVQVGPYDRQKQAHRAARRLERELGEPVLLIRDR
jgi:rare lipoprotein A